MQVTQDQDRTQAEKNGRPGKGTRTRNSIIQAVAPLFNRYGYSESSMREICEAAGIQKGGLYNHFASKAELAEASFAWSSAHVAAALDVEMQSVVKNSAVEQIIHLAKAYAQLYAQDKLFPAGCPVLNTGIEAKGDFVNLRDPARNAVDKLRQRILTLAKAARKNAELRAEFKPQKFADTMVALLEGAMFLSVLNNDMRHLRNTAEHLQFVLDAYRPA